MSPGKDENGTQDRRRFPRVPLLTDAWILEAGQRMHVRTMDISSAGLQIVMERPPWQSGTRLKIAIRLPETTQELDLEAEVAWRSTQAAGLHFLAVPDVAARHIDATVERILAEVQSFQDEKTPTRQE